MTVQDQADATDLPAYRVQQTPAQLRAIPPQDTSDPPSELPAGAIYAITGVVALVSMLLAALGVLLLRRRWAQKDAAERSPLSQYNTVRCVSSVIARDVATSLSYCDRFCVSGVCTKMRRSGRPAQVVGGCAAPPLCVRGATLYALRY